MLVGAERQPCVALAVLVLLCLVGTASLSAQSPSEDPAEPEQPEEPVEREEPEKPEEPLGFWEIEATEGQEVTDSGPHELHGHVGSETRGVRGAAERIVSEFGEPTYRSLYFDGADDRVVVPDAPELEPTTVAVEVCVRAPLPPGINRYLVAKGAKECELSSYALYSHNRGLAFQVSDGERAVVSPAVAEEDIWDGEWHHVLGIFDGSTVRLLVDGREVGTPTPAELEIAYDLPTSRGLYFGHFPGSCNLAFRGELDWVRIGSEPPGEDDLARDVLHCRLKQPCTLAVDTRSEPPTLRAVEDCSPLSLRAGEGIAVGEKVPE